MSLKSMVVILGASNNPMRPSYMANKILKTRGYKTLGIGFGHEGEFEASKNLLQIGQEKSVAIFLKPDKQKKYYDYILSLQPNRIIFNPGTENQELISLANKMNIKVITGCTIALIANGLL